ncbi:MAG: Holliday junction branch migration protein RuvA [Candidatus Cohnella colombiensis]|uniref:Holliday junction branch migration complex subunit RuvA n=1 Tax=Candidatus Cohnella colombiensis TaxID=3121368 RepID=A0AA95JGV3_9BACL|nr:MAG: Holliday junction branch migration protein RuvA [Cohnella sp.]
MIDYLRGRVTHYETEYVVLEVRDIGYRVFTPNPYGLARSEESIQMFIHYHVREDATQLFGFTTRDEQTLFRKLLDVSGIGPKVALGVLVGGRPESIVAAIQQENITFLTKLPGIGKKTAQRMILDLKDKLSAMDGQWNEAALFAQQLPDTNDTSSSWLAAREALLGLGYRDAELDKAWHVLKGTVTGDETADQLIKKALQQLFQG